MNQQLFDLIKKYLVNNPGRSTYRISKDLNIPYSTVTNNLDRLCRKGVVISKDVVKGYRESTAWYLK